MKARQLPQGKLYPFRDAINKLYHFELCPGPFGSKRTCVATLLITSEGHRGIYKGHVVPDNVIAFIGKPTLEPLIEIQAFVERKQLNEAMDYIEEHIDDLI